MLVLKEGLKWPRALWLNTLRLGDDEFNALAAQNIFSEDRDSGDKPVYRLSLVGVLFSTNGAFVSVPKIFTAATDPVAVMLDVISCIRTYFRRKTNRVTKVSASEQIASKEGRLIDTFLAILRWTSTYGFHTEPVENHDFDITDIDWYATFDTAVPLHIGNTVVYSDIISRSVNPRLGALAALQARCLLDLHSHLGPVSHLWVHPHDDLLHEARGVMDSSIHDESPRTVADVRDFLNSCNLDADRELAFILLDWLKQSPKGSLHVGAFGTTSFHYVWEDMCRVAMLAGETPLQHSAVASQPHYVIAGAGPNCDNQLPDILFGDYREVFIYDAKWYVAEEGQLPGVSDIVKQLVYEKSTDPGLTVKRNAFLVPVRSGRVEVMGKAFMRFADESKTPDGRFPEISVIALPWDLAVSTYCGMTPPDHLKDAISSLPSR